MFEPSAIENAFPSVRHAMDHLYYDNQIWTCMSALKLSSYELSELGDLRGIANKYIFSRAVDKKGYIANSLCDDDGNNRAWYRHILVATIYVENPDGKPLVDHIDTCRANNRWDNLRWATRKENGANCLDHGHTKLRRPVAQYTLDGTLVKTYASATDAALYSDLPNVYQAEISKHCISGTAYREHIWKYIPKPDAPEIPDEVWKEITVNETVVQVSSMGRVKKANGEIYEGFSKNDYLATSVKGQDKSVHQLVCHAFHGPPPSDIHTVDHVNQVTTDNRAENLRWATPGEQAINRKPASTGRRNRPIVRIDPSNGEETRFDNIKDAVASITDVASRFKSLSSHIYIACKARLEGKKYNMVLGYNWRYGDCFSPPNMSNVFLFDADL